MSRSYHIHKFELASIYFRKAKYSESEVEVHEMLDILGSKQKGKFFPDMESIGDLHYLVIEIVCHVLFPCQWMKSYNIKDGDFMRWVIQLMEEILPWFGYAL
jgi:hypothetical protein